LYPETVDVLALQVRVTECCVATIPAPDKDTFVGEPEALLTIVTCPASFPAADGLNCTPIVNFCEGDRVTGTAAPLIVKPVPLMLIPESVTFAFPVSVIVIFWVAALPVFTLPKLRLDALNDSVAAAATPVPLNANVVGDVGALLTSESPPVEFPADCGEN
jgi:hypothetical protein